MRRRSISILVACIVVGAGAWLARSPSFPWDMDAIHTITDIRYAATASGGMLRIDYSSAPTYAMRYSVNEAQPEDMIDSGETRIPASEVGRHVYAIAVHDARFGDDLVRRYPINRTHDIANERTLRISYPPDDATLMIYIGSEQPMAASGPHDIAAPGGSIPPIGAREGTIVIGL